MGEGRERERSFKGSRRRSERVLGWGQCHGLGKGLKERERAF